MLSNGRLRELDALQRYIGRCDATGDHAEVYIQGEDYAIKQVILPTTCYYMAFRYLETHHEGRSPSHIDCQASLIQADTPGMSFDQAVVAVIDTFIAKPGFIGRVAEALEDEGRDWRDSGDFRAVQAARDETWRRARGDKTAPLAAAFH